MVHWGTIWRASLGAPRGLLLDEAHYPHEDPDRLDLSLLFPTDVEVGAAAWALHLCRQICVRESGAESETAEQLLLLGTASSNNWSTLHSAGMEARAVSWAEP